MIIFDFLVYHLTIWFEKNKKRLVWSTPLEKGINVLVLIIMGLFAEMNLIFEKFIYKKEVNPLLYKVGIIFCFITLYALFKHIYIKGGRYENIISKNFGVTKKVGIIISLFASFLFIIGWFIITIIISLI